MALSEQDVRYVAKLAALELSDEEVLRMQKDLGEILEYFSKLSAVSSLGVMPTSHVHGVVNFFRDDVIKDSFSQEQAGENAPDFTNGFFRVPKIL